jgi:hypothetical protein
MLPIEASDSNDDKRIHVTQALPECATGASEGPRSSLTLSLGGLRISKPVSLINEQRALL